MATAAIILLELLYFRFDVEEDTDGLSESVDYLIMGYVKHSVPVRDVAHKLYLPHRFYPLNIFPRYKIYVLVSFKYIFLTLALHSFIVLHKFKLFLIDLLVERDMW